MIDLHGVSGTYLIHAHAPLKQVHHRKDGTPFIVWVRHYIGYAGDIAARITAHRKGNGSKLMAAFVRAGIGWDVVEVWPDTDRDFERRLHNRKNSTRYLCPICSRRKSCV